MAKITNPSKLLPSAKTTTITKVGKSGLISPININKKSVAIVKSNDVGGKLVNIEKFLKSDLIISQKKAEVKRKEKEKQNFDAAEKKLETPQSKGLRLPGISAPSLGFLDRVKRFLFFTALGWLLPKILEFLPKLEGFAKIVGGIYKFGEGLFGKLFDGFMSLVKFGGDLKDKTLGFIAELNVGKGANFQKEFDKLEKQFNTFVNASIIAGVLSADIGSAAVDEYNKWRKKNVPEPSKPGKKPSVKPRTTPSTTKPGKSPSWMDKVFKGPFAKLKGPLSRFAGVAVPGLGAAVGTADAYLRFKSGDKIGGTLASISAALDAATAITALTGIGLPVAGVLGTISIGIDVLLLIRDILPLIGVPKNLLGFSRGGRVVRRYQGGGTTRGGRPVGGSPRRTIAPVRRKKPPRVSLPKTQPGKDVGGEKKVKEFYAKPQDESKKYLRPAGGWLSTLFDGEKKDLSTFDTLKKMSGTLKSDETLAKGILGLMSSGIDMALGQKPDRKIFKSFFDTIGYVSDTLASQRANMSMSSLMSQLRGFAEGGTVPSRGLRGTYGDTGTGDLLAKLIGPTIDQRVNEAIQSIEKELMMKSGKKDGTGPGAGGGPSGPDGGPIDQGLGRKSGGSQELRNEVIKAAAQLGIDAPSLLGAILAESGGDPSRTNQFGCTGLIQFCPGPSAGQAVIGKSGAQLRKMSIKEQMPYVVKYLKSVGVKRGMSGFDIYSAIHAGRPGGNLTDANGVTTKGFYESNVKPLIDSAREEQRMISGPGAITADKIYPLDSSQGRDPGQPGIDFTYKGGKTLALYPGKVTDIGSQYNSDGSGYGNYVLVESVDPNTGRKFTTLYAHFGDGKISVRKGDTVQSGAIIGAQPNRNIRGHFTGSGSGEHTSADFYEPDGRTRYSGANKLITQVLDSFAGKNPYPTQAATPVVQPPTQRPPNLNVINVSGMSGPQIAAKIKNIKPGQKVVFPGVGSVQGGKDWLGKSQTKYFDPQGKPLTEAEFTERVRKKIQSQPNQANKPPGPVPAPNLPGRFPGGTIEGLQQYGALQKQGGGLIAPSKSNRPNVASHTSYNHPASNGTLLIQPMIYYVDKPSTGGNKMIAFPVPIAVNSSMPDLSSSRG
jgi:hypothetical protein